eukprot:249170-Pelagomonas_calceolata.AAC.9
MELSPTGGKKKEANKKRPRNQIDEDVSVLLDLHVFDCWTVLVWCITLQSVAVLKWCTSFGHKSRLPCLLPDDFI